MSKKNKKRIATLLIIVVSIILYSAFMYINAIKENHIPEFVGIMFAIIPALAINAIWNKKYKKKEKNHL